jgi:NAD(P)-dependent dehydrogenase (short-subunit alcohol dehydrogenase family)
MSKAAQIAVARGIAEDCARTGVTVNSILPGPTLDSDDPRSAARFGGRPIADVEAQLFKNQRPTSIIKRFARTEEVASLVAYVASPLSSATTGAALRVDGGVVKSAF